MTSFGECRNLAGRSALVLALLCGTAACDEGEPGAGDGGANGGGGEDGASGGGGGEGGQNTDEGSLAGPLTGADREVRELQGHPLDKLDLLFVIDDSASMQEEQAALAAQLPRLIRVLASGDLEDGSPDANGNTGAVDFPPVRDMHLGVVSTNMGVPVDGLADGLDDLPPSADSCRSPGDDGLLRFPKDCGGKSDAGNFLEFQAGDDVAALGQNFACISQLGTDGCGQEQQLDAMLKALSHDPEITFQNGSIGHGGPDPSAPNGRFVREDAVLVVVMLTDEEDCSLPDDNAALMSFAASGTAALTSTTTGEPIDLNLATPLNLRCGSYPDALHPIDRYVEGLRRLKPLNPELVVFAALAGVPAALEGMPEQDILASPDMQFQPSIPDEPFNPQNAPVPSCSRDHDGDPSTPTQNAYPPRRLVELADRLGDNGIVQSICQDDFTAPVDVVAERVSDMLSTSCLPRPLERGDDGLVGCDMVELLPDVDGQGEALCDESKGRTPLASKSVEDAAAGNPVTYQACKINQLPVLDGELAPNPDAEDLGIAGWYYDDFSDEVLDMCSSAPHRLTFAPGDDPELGASVRLECD